MQSIFDLRVYLFSILAMLASLSAESVPPDITEAAVSTLKKATDDLRQVLVHYSMGTKPIPAFKPEKGSIAEILACINQAVVTAKIILANPHLYNKEAMQSALNGIESAHLVLTAFDPVAPLAKTKETPKGSKPPAKPAKEKEPVKPVVPAPDVEVTIDPPAGTATPPA